MGTKVNVNNRTVVHAQSGGKCIMFPDVCKVPAPPAPPIPTPFPDLGQSSDTSSGTESVKADGESLMVKGACFSKTSGDEAGSLGGMVSNTTRGKAEFVNYSFDVKAEGKNMARLADPMFGNKGSAANTPPIPEVQPPDAGITKPMSDESTNQSLVKVSWKR